MAPVEDDPPVYGGVICTKSVCGWIGSDPSVRRCPRCGNFNRAWLTDVVELIPPEVIEAHRRSGEPIEPLPPVEDDDDVVH